MAPLGKPLSARASPARNVKHVSFVRHGEGYHNVAGHLNPANYGSYDHEDAHLTDLGFNQAATLRRHVASVGLRVDLVVVSPLTRTLETAVGVFGGATWVEGESSPPLMVAATAQPGKRSTRINVSGLGCPPFIANELCREIIGVNPCDKRRTVTHYTQQHPGIDFSLMETDADVTWTRERRESLSEINGRALRFVQWLMTRPEQHIAVVSHCEFLHCVMTLLSHPDDREHELSRWYRNCEMRTVVLGDGSGGFGPVAQGQDPYHYPGGVTVAMEEEIAEDEALHKGEQESVAVAATF